jgi:hypothetical protein
MGRWRPGDGTVRTGRDSKGGDISKVAGREQVKWFFDTLATSLANGDEVCTAKMLISEGRSTRG